MKRFLLFITMAILTISMAGCGNNQVERPSEIQIEEGIKTALKDDEHIEFDKMSDFTYNEVEVNDSDMEILKSKYASRVDYVKYETTFSLVSVAMDMKANYSVVFAYNNGEWSYSFGYITDKDLWEYTEKDASKVDKQRMLSDLKNEEFASFEKGYVGNPKYSSIQNITNRDYDESVHRDTIETSVLVKTDFAEYEIPIKMIYYFSKGEWIVGDIEISDSKDWVLTYNNGSVPEFLGDNIILSYLTTDTNFLTYVCNLNYVDDYSITKESEIANKDSVDVRYIFSTRYDNIGTVNYNVDISYQWLSNEWSDAEPQVTFRNADFSDLLKNTYNCENGEYFKFTNIEETDDLSYKLTGQYVTDKTTDISCVLTVPLRDNNWEANILDINGNQIGDIPASTFSLNLEYSSIVYNNMNYNAVEIVIPEESQEQAEKNTSNELIYGLDSYNNEITKDNLMFNEINVSYDGSSKITIEGNINNLSDGASEYKVSAALFDENGIVLGEGAFDGDSQLTENSSEHVSFDINDINNDTNAKIKKITIYINK